MTIKFTGNIVMKGNCSFTLSAPPPAFTLGTAGNSSSSATLTMNPTSSVSVGQLVVIAVSDGSGTYTGSTVSDNAGNSYTQAILDNGSQIFYSFVTHALTTSSVITYTSASANVGTSYYYAMLGVLVTSGVTAIDSAITNSSYGYGTSFSVTGAGTAAHSGELNIFVAFGTYTLLSSSSGTELYGHISSPAYVWIAYEIDSGTSPLTFSGTNTGGSDNIASMIVAFH